MRRVIITWLEGLAVCVPVLFTIWVLVTSVTWLDDIMFGWFGESVPAFWGVGAMMAMGLIYLVGLATRLYLFQKILALAEAAIGRLPLVKTLYGSVRDMLQFFRTGSGRPTGAAVRIQFDDDTHMLGITTTEDTESNRVGVYLPLSYQIGGFLVYFPRERLTPLDMDVESALKLVLTGGMGTSVSSEASEASDAPKTVPELLT